MIIGLSGYARSGKDTVAKILVEEYAFERIAFADKIRELLFEINPVLAEGQTLNELVTDYGWEIAKTQPKVRSLLQSVGVACRTVLGDDIWIHALWNELQLYDKHYVISDVRFKNEADFVREAGGQLWRINRASINPVNNHISESDLDDYTFTQTIDNDGSIDDLKALIKSFKISPEELQEYKDDVL
jgi:hypothetical protein